MDGLELMCFRIISTVGSAKSSYIEAIQKAKQGQFIDAKALIEEGKALFVEGHHVHAELLYKEANNEKTEFSLLLIHTEDQLMSADSFCIIAEEIISVYERLTIEDI